LIAKGEPHFMKYCFALFFTFCLQLTVDAQTYSIEWSEMERSKGKLIYLLPNKVNEFFALRWTGGRLLGSYQVSKHENLKLTGSGRIRLIAEESMANFEGARIIGGKFVVFLSDRREGENHFYMQKYDDALKPVGEPIKLASYSLDRKRAKGWFEVKLSANKKYFGVVWEVPGRKEERDLYGFKIYDNELNLINDGEYPLPFDPDLSVIHSHHISNSGDYFLALTEYQEGEKRTFLRNRLNYKALHIYHITDDGLQDYKLDLEGKRVEAMAMTSDDKGVFTITGIYGKMKESGVSGVFHQRVDLNTEQKLDEGFKEFTEEFIVQGWTDRERKRQERREDRGKEDAQLYNYKMREATILDDGSIVGTMEQYYIQVRTYTDTRSGQSSSTYYYYYNDIIAYKINAEGDFDWVEKVRKYQVSTNDGGPFSSYESFIDNGKVYFIFNDNVRNYNEDGVFSDNDRLYTANYGRRKNAVALAEIDMETGEKERRTFFDRTEIDALAVPKLFDVNYSTGEMILYSIWGRKEKIGVLRFKK